jgi:hypothetical protein
MGRQPHAGTVQVRRHLLVILADAGKPISTPDVLVAMSRRVGCNNPETTPVCRFAGDPRGSCPAWCWNRPVYPQLRAMAKLGLVQRIRVPDHRCVYWQRADNETDEAMNQLLDQNTGEPAGTSVAGDSDHVRQLYRERAHLISALVRRAVLDAGQVSCHINPDDLPLFAAVPVVDPGDSRARWDGHDKQTVLTRLATLATGQSRGHEAASEQVGRR